MDDESSSSSNEQEQEEQQNVYTTVSESSSDSEEEESAEDGQHDAGDADGNDEVDEQQQQQQQQPVQQSIKEIVFADEEGNVIASAPAVVSEDTLYLTVGTREAVSIPDSYFETQILSDGFSAAYGLVIIFIVFAIFGTIVSRTLLRSFEND